MKAYVTSKCVCMYVYIHICIIHMYTHRFNYIYIYIYIYISYASYLYTLRSFSVNACITHPRSTHAYENHTIYMAFPPRNSSMSRHQCVSIGFLFMQERIKSTSSASSLRRGLCWASTCTARGVVMFLMTQNYGRYACMFVPTYHVHKAYMYVYIYIYIFIIDMFARSCTWRWILFRMFACVPSRMLFRHSSFSAHSSVWGTWSFLITCSVL
jgi:hypothetical protein